MVSIDHFILAVNGIRKRSLRSWLTIIGIFIGIAALVSLVSLGQGLETAVTDQFTQLGADKIFVTPGGVFGPPGSSVGSLDDHDLAVVRRVKGVDLVAGETFGFVSAKFKDKTKSVPMVGYMLKGQERDLLFEAGSHEVIEGRLLKSGDKKKVVVGWDHAHKEDIFGKVVKIGDTVEIQGVSFKVVGIAKKLGSPIDDKIMHVPIDDAFEITGEEDQYDYVIVKVEENVEPATIAERIKTRMRKDRGLKEGEEDFGVETFESIMATFESILFVVQAVIIGIASISLIVGGIGIMNTMYTAVLERTKEIGIMKAVGARNSDVLFLFLFESGLLGLIGGGLGVVIGIGLSKMVEFGAQQAFGSPLIKAVIPPYLVIGALLFSFVVGSLSGILPAMQASKLKPVDALRYE